MRPLRDLAPGPWLALLLAVSLSLRLALAAAGPSGPTWVDGEQYWSIARNLAEHGRYANASPTPPGAPPYADVGPTSFWLPGYPFLLAAVVLVFGASPGAIFVLQALLGTGTVALVAALGARLGGRATGLLAGAVCALSPFQLYHTARFASETATAFLLALQAWLLLRVLDGVRAGGAPRRWMIALWAACACGILLRSVFVPVSAACAGVVLLALYWAGRQREALRSAAVGALVGACLLLPWLLRNAALWGELVYHTKSGFNLLVGFNELADGRYGTAAVPRLSPELYDELARSRILAERALHWIRSYPLEAAHLALWKLALFWSPFHDQHSLANLRGLVTFAWSGPLLTGAAFGAVQTLRRDRFPALVLLILVAVYSATHVAAFSALRFRVPLGVLLAVLAAYGGVDLVRRLRLPSRACARSAS